MAIEVKGLDVKVGDLVRIEGRRYDVVSDKAGGVALEQRSRRRSSSCTPTPAARPLSPGEFDEVVWDLPRDGEG